MNLVTLPKPSFRVLLLAAFLVIVALLGATSVQALLTLERLAGHSRQTAQDAVQLTENAQRLAERTLAMERSARQFLVLNDPAFRIRYNEAWAEARQALNALSVQLTKVPAGEFEAWVAHSKSVSALLQTDPLRREQNQEALARVFVRLPAINALLSSESKLEVERRNNALLTELEQQRSVLKGQVTGAIALTALFAFGFGVWLSRPLARIEAAISRLGENRFEQPIEVHGPADLRRIGRQLDWLRQRLADLEADKARFLRHISHELKTPLAALREGVALLEEEVVGTLSDNQREIAAILRQNTIALQTQIEDLLRYNAAAFGGQQLHCVPTALRALLQRVIDLQRLQWQARDLLIEVSSPDQVASVDPEKLQVALANLLSNAVRFSPQGGTIRFVLGSSSGRITIDCVDEGPGVAPADAARIFEPFYQGTRQPQGARHGNGIGLSIVQEYVAAHRGTVQLLAHSNGAHFRIEIPG
ncbi:MAG: ATP-binding protein [Oxalobacteraceae bacterium]|nr:ATP-binding protein [Oxalobacteraceae bacterium]